jgi:hypothetical protein
LATGENRLLHPGLRSYYDALRSLTRDPVFAPQRLGHLWRMALGEYNAGFRAFTADHYHRPPRVSLPLAELPQAVLAALIRETGATALAFNRRYEPAGRSVDGALNATHP